MCSYIDIVLKKKQSLYENTEYIPNYFESCLQPLDDYCGNGVVNFLNNEECDTLPFSKNSHCCNNCSMVPGALCASMFYTSYILSTYILFTF